MAHTKDAKEFNLLKMLHGKIISMFEKKLQFLRPCRRDFRQLFFSLILNSPQPPRFFNERKDSEISPMQQCQTFRLFSSLAARFISFE